MRLEMIVYQIWRTVTCSHSSFLGIDLGIKRQICLWDTNRPIHLELKASRVPPGLYRKTGYGDAAMGKANG